MRFRSIQRVVLFVALCSVAAYLGCATPKPCTVSPVAIEEIKADIRDLDKSLSEDKDILARLEADVAQLQARIAERKTQVPALQAQYDSLKKASGVTEKPVEEKKPQEEKKPAQPKTGVGK